MTNMKMENGKHMACPICGEWWFWSEEGLKDCLIADAAPDLLEACEMVITAIGESNSVRRTVLEMHAWKAVSAAIAKAKGES